MQPERGTILDHYKLLARVGSGSCGTVWQAENIVSGETVALKILIDSNLAERELRALKLYRELQHPAMIRIRHIGRAGENFFYIMDWCESSLAERKVSARELLEIARKLANGLILLHSHGLLHRDIKPANIFFRQGEPVLGDIGLLTRQKGATFAGSPGFFSPDILAGKCAADRYSDCYAFAKSIYCALSGLGPEQFPVYTGEMTPEASLLMRAVLAVCSEAPAVHDAEGFLNFLNHPPPLRRSRHALLWSGLAIGLCMTAGGLWLRGRNKPPCPENKSVRNRPAPAGVQERAVIHSRPHVSSLSRQETEQRMTALPTGKTESLRRLRLEAEVSKLIGSSGKLQLSANQENALCRQLTPEQQKLYKECIAGIQALQSTALWREAEKQWRQREFEYRAQIREKEQADGTDAENALRQIAAQEPLLSFRISQAVCISRQKALLDAARLRPDELAGRLEAFFAAEQEYRRAVVRLQYHQR